jgi:hypothetical protein
MTDPEEIYPPAVAFFGQDAPTPQIFQIQTPDTSDLAESMPISGDATCWKIARLRARGFRLVRLESAGRAQWFAVDTGLPTA